MSAPTGTLLNDTFTRTIVNGIGTADDGNTYTTSGPIANYSVNGTRLIVQNPTPLVAHRIVPSVVDTNSPDIWVEFQDVRVPVGGAWALYLEGRFVDASNHYFLRLLHYPDLRLTQTLCKIVGGVVSLLTSEVVVTASMDTSKIFVGRFRITGNADGSKPRLQAHTFMKSSGEPVGWHLDVVDSSASQVADSAAIALTQQTFAGNTSGNAGQVALLVADDLATASSPPNAPVLSAVVHGGSTVVHDGDTVNAPSIDLAFASTAPPAVDHYTVSTDGGSPTTHTSPLQITVAAGAHSAVVVAVGADLQESPSATFHWTYGVSGHTGTTYTPADPADTGYKIRAKVVGVNATGQSSPVATAWSQPVVNLSVPANTTPPVVSGSLSRGNTLSCSPGAWSGGGVLTYLFQWKRGGVSIAGATTNKYVTVSPDDNGANIKCTVRARNGAGTSVSVDSNTVGPVTLDPPVNVRLPAITSDSGDVSVIGAILRGDTGDWSGSLPLTLGIQWYHAPNVNGVPGDFAPISGATDGQYTPGPADVGFLEIGVTPDNGIT